MRVAVPRESWMALKCTSVARWSPGGLRTVAGMYSFLAGASERVYRADQYKRVMKICCIVLSCLAGLLVLPPSPVFAQSRDPAPVRRAGGGSSASKSRGRPVTLPRARPAPKRVRTPRLVKAVLLVERGRPKARATLVAALRSQLSRRGVRLDVLALRRFGRKLPTQLAMARRAAALRGATVVIWFSLTRSVPLFVYFVEGQGGRLVMRGFGEMETDERAEAAAIVVQSALLGYVRGERPGTDVGALPLTLRKLQRSQPRPKPAAPTGRLSLELGYGYAYDDWDAELSGLHGVQVQMAVRLHSRWSLLAGYQWGGPVSLVDPEGRAEVRLRPHRFSLGVRLQFGRGRWQLGAALSVAAELIDYVVLDQPLVTDLDVRPLMLFSLVPCFHAGLRVFNRLRLVVDVGLEVELRTPTLRLDLPGASGGSAKLGRPEVVRPRVLLALAVDLL